MNCIPASPKNIDITMIFDSSAGHNVIFEFYISLNAISDTAERTGSWGCLKIHDYKCKCKIDINVQNVTNESDAYIVMRLIIIV